MSTLFGRLQVNGGVDYWLVPSYQHVTYAYHKWSSFGQSETNQPRQWSKKKNKSVEKKKINDDDDAFQIESE